MDNKLLTLWRYYPSGSIRMEEISETLQLSSKQTTRYLKNGWRKAGYHLHPDEDAETSQLCYGKRGRNFLRGRSFKAI